MRLSDPLDSGRIELAHRLVFPPMATQSSQNGMPGTQMIAHYTAIAANPLVGLIITEHSYIDRQGKADPRQVSFATDDVVAPQRELTGAVHRANPQVKMFAQISHAGAATSPRITGQPLVSASDIQMGNSPARALSADEIHAIERSFAQAAWRVKSAGYDGVELHAAHGYLLNQFYSPLTNDRTDEYGPQNVENRLRFLLETVAAVRRAVGDDYPIAVRFGGCDYLPGGSTIQDAAQAARLLEAAGIDLIDLSGGMNGFTRRDARTPGWFSDLSTAVKGATHIPVLVTGGVQTPEQAEALLGRGAADLIGVGRALFRNPRWGAGYQEP